MAREIDQAHLLEYTGEFSFDHKLILEFIKTAKPDYDHTDPKTWPLITSAYLNKWLIKPYSGVLMLPPFIAYERSLVDLCVADREDGNVELVREDGVKTVRSRFHHHFPFIYNHNGHKRKFEYMHADHYTSWVFGVTGKVPATRTKGKDTPSASADPFDEILELIQDAQHAHKTDGATSLRAELESAHKDLDESKKRVVAAEAQQKLLDKELTHERRRAEGLVQSKKALKQDLQKAFRGEMEQHTITQKQLERVNRELADTNKLWREATNETIAAEARSKKLEKTLKDRDKDLQVSREQAATLQEQMVKIRNELKKGMEDGGQKRQADSNASSSQKKKVKIQQ
ncbi:hypothetical protein DE146DRAFT_756371 [Phaeosphaeria sp. MPI-PUGE-AT-0046c]|nr:hypothetical protein DE146DRAFT_756371 [Phaeosphaeria sp. MPI-PUGE-AT-0046c]